MLPPQIQAIIAALDDPPPLSPAQQRLIQRVFTPPREAAQAA